MLSLEPPTLVLLLLVLRGACGSECVCVCVCVCVNVRVVRDYMPRVCMFEMRIPLLSCSSFLACALYYLPVCVCVCVCVCVRMCAFVYYLPVCVSVRV
jgi:hypothetical protein